MSESGEWCVGTSDLLLRLATRRRFLRLLGAAGSVVLLPGLFASCEDRDAVTAPQPGNFRLDLSTDNGILNFAYALEQLEAAFYTAALTSTAFGQLSTAEKEVIADLQAHEVIHRELLKRLLASAAIPSIAFSATTI